MLAAAKANATYDLLSYDEDAPTEEAEEVDTIYSLGYG